MTFLLACAFAFLGVVLPSYANRVSQSAGRSAEGRTAEQVYKNIQIFRELPAEDLMRTMHLMRSSLGVRCDFCHDVEHYEADTKTAKSVARRMIQMVLDLNTRAFEGRAAVTCNSCHRGAVRPLAVPPIAQGHFADTTRTGAPVTSSNRPTARDILYRYVEAAGGRNAIELVKERVAEGVFISATVVAGATNRSTIVNRGKSEPAVVRVRAGGEIHLAAGTGTDVLTLDVKDGKGVARRQSVERQMTPKELHSFVQKLDLQRALKLLDRAVSMRVLDRVDIDGNPMNVVEQRLPDGRSEHLYFDVERGLLRRSIVLSPTPVGPDPEQLDFEDYRNVDGIAVPFVIKTSYIDDNHYGTTLQFTRVRDVR